MKRPYFIGGNMTTGLLSLLIALVIFGAILYLLQLVPMDATVKQIVRVIAIVLIVIYAISVLTKWLK